MKFGHDIQTENVKAYLVGMTMPKWADHNQEINKYSCIPLTYACGAWKLYPC